MEDKKQESREGIFTMENYFAGDREHQKIKVLDLQVLKSKVMHTFGDFYSLRRIAYSVEDCVTLGLLDSEVLGYVQSLLYECIEFYYGKNRVEEYLAWCIANS